MPNLTPTILDRTRLPSNKSQLIIRDAREPGLLARIGKHKTSLAIEIMVDGHMHRETLGGYPSLSIESARDRIRALRRELENAAPEVPQITVADALDRYVRERQAQKKLSIRSAFSYRELTAVKLHDIGDTPIADLTNETIVNLWDSLVDKPGARQRAFAILRAVLNWSCRRYGLANPIDAVAGDIGQSGEASLLPELKRNGHRALRDVVRISRNYSDRTLATWYEVTVFTGIRSEQLRKLTWNNIDFEQRLLIFEEFKSARFEGDWCIVPASDHVLELLQKWQAQSALRHLEERRAMHVFPARNRHGELPYVRESKGLINHIQKEVRFRTGAHQLRKLYETIADEIGVPPQHTDILLGRAPSGLKRRYSFASAESARESMEQITGRLLGLVDDTS